MCTPSPLFFTLSLHDALPICRAGRDGLPAQAWMIYGMGNVMFQRQLIDQSQTPEEQKRIEHTKLNAFLGYCEAATCRRNNLLRYLGEQAHTPCGNCDVRSEEHTSELQSRGHI